MKYVVRVVDPVTSVFEEVDNTQTDGWAVVAAIQALTTALRDPNFKRVIVEIQKTE